MASTTTTVFPKKGVTLYLPGGTHGFSDPAIGVPLRSDHAEVFLKAGRLGTAPPQPAQREKPETA